MKRFFKPFSSSTAKWIANICYVVATILMGPKDMAADSTIPWMLYLVGNIIWLGDSVYREEKQWVALAIFFVVWSLLLMFQRMFS